MTILKRIDLSWMNSADLRCPAEMTGSYLFKDCEDD